MRKCMQIKAMYCTRHFIFVFVKFQLTVDLLSRVLATYEPRIFHGGMGPTLRLYVIYVVL